MIQQHTIDKDYTLKEYEYLKSILEEMTETSLQYGKFTGLRMKALEAAGCAIYFSDHDNAIRYLRLTLDAIISTFSLANNPGKDVEIQLGQKRSTFKGKETQSDISTAYWKTGMRIAIILRNKEAIDFFIRIPERLLRKSNLQGDEYDYLFVDFFKALLSNDPKAAMKLLKAYNATDPKMLKIERADNVLNYAAPEMELYISLLEDNHGAFNQRLETALTLYRKFVESFEYYDQAPNFCWAMNLTAAASIAFGNDIPVTVESDYIPRWMVEGKF